MPIIKPSTDVRNNYPEISRICRETGQPIYITVNGRDDTAIINSRVLDALYARLDLYAKLAEGEKDIEEGNTFTHEEVFSQFKVK